MRILPESVRKRLLSNQFIEKISDSNISYTSEFKIFAVKANLNGKSPSDIFKEAGIDVDSFVRNYAAKTISRWKKTYEEEGEKGLVKEKRGKNSTGRPRDKEFSSVEAELEYLRLENEFLKKLHALAESKKTKNSR
jgi:transposase-like protein